MQRAFTLIETLVVIAILGIIVALLLPAVQSAREAARKASCVNNLKQFGIALSSYGNVHQVYPQGSNGNGFSLHVMVLPFLENGKVYGALNFESFSYGLGSLGSNHTVFKTSIAEFLCPSDYKEERIGKTNYAGNGGYGRPMYQSNGLFSDNYRNSYVSVAKISDGTSNTAALSEWVLSRSGIVEHLESVFMTEKLTKADQYDRFVIACRELDLNSAVAPNGKTGVWPNGGFGDSLMNHSLTVNQHSCLNGNSITRGAWTAGSRHPDGANVLFLDGSVHFISQSIAQSVWRSFSTYNGQEIISSNSY